MAIKIILTIGSAMSLLGMIVPIFPAPTVMWVMALIYGLVTKFQESGLVFFAIISLLAVIASFTDNAFIVGRARQTGASWTSITVALTLGLFGSLLLTPFVGIPITLGTMYLWEYRRQQDQAKAWDTTKKMLTAWGWSFLVRFSLGCVMMALFAVWAWK